MALRKTRQLPRVGMPEFIAVFFLGLAGYLVADYWGMRGAELWATAPGKVVAGEIDTTHYNAEPSDPKITLDYEYAVYGSKYQGHWIGFWPAGSRTNALPPGEFARLIEPGHELVVLYDPDNPERSRLHDSDPDPVVTSTLLAFGGGLVFLIYCVKVYPAWKARQRLRHG